MANFGNIPSNLALGASKSVRRNSGDTDFEAFTALESGVSHYDDLLPTLYQQLAGGAAPNITLVGASTVLRAQEFANSSAAEEYLPIWQLPHAWKAGSNVEPHLHLYIPDDGTGGDLTFSMTYTWTNIDDTSVTESTVTGTVTRAANAGINGNAILSFGGISGSGKTASSLFRARITRSQTDTFGGTCWLLSSDMHIEKDKLGASSAP